MVRYRLWAPAVFYGDLVDSIYMGTMAVNGIFTIGTWVVKLDNKPYHLEGNLLEPWFLLSLSIKNEWMTIDIIDWIHILKYNGRDATDAAWHSRINTWGPGQSTPDSSIWGLLVWHDMLGSLGIPLHPENCLCLRHKWSPPNRSVSEVPSKQHVAIANTIL